MFVLKGITTDDLQGADGARAFVLNFGEDSSTQGVTTPLSLAKEAGREAFYTLDGRRLSGRPSQPGLYISNGKKVVIKR